MKNTNAFAVKDGCIYLSSPRPPEGTGFCLHNHISLDSEDFRSAENGKSGANPARSRHCKGEHLANATGVNLGRRKGR